MQTIHSRTKTWLKTGAQDSSTLTKLSPKDVLSGKRMSKQFALEWPEGVTLPVSETDGARSGKHTLIKVDMKALRSEPFNKAVKALGREGYYVWSEHVKVIGNARGNRPQVATQSNATLASVAAVANPRAKSPLDYPFKLKGFKSTFMMSKPIVNGGRLNWAEATHFDPQTKRFRPPESSDEVNHIVNMAKIWFLWARPFLAKRYNVDVSDVSVRINSWYRDPKSNRAVGGARYSRHIAGDAVDFLVYIKGKQINPHTINKMLHPHWPGGLASASCFTHLDLRGGVRFENGRLVGGQYARWSYGF